MKLKHRWRRALWRSAVVVGARFVGAGPGPPAIA